MVVFMGALVSVYFLARRLFDPRLAAIVAGLTIISQIYWDYAMSGLPQTLLLLLFSLSLHALLRAVDAVQEGKRAALWLATTGAAFGLLALAHAMTIWIFLGALAFIALKFRPRPVAALGVLAVFLAVYSPWLFRNFAVYGNPFGVSQYACLSGIRGTENAIMRSVEINFFDVLPTYWKNKVLSNTVLQFGDLYGLLGHSLAAPMFFLALLHPFKAPAAATFRWALLLMWLTGTFGMAVFGFDSEPRLHPHNMHPLFAPFFAAFGVAFLLVLWQRLEIGARLLRYGLIALVFLVSGIPLLSAFFGEKQAKIHWPPYLPPFVGVLSEWTNEREIIMSDMPWAVAWYADRKSLWLTKSIKDFVEMNDYDHLGGAIVGLYLTPVTGNSPFVSGIMKGDYKDWAPFITRNVTAKDFPLRAATGLPIDNECIFYADRDRWTERTD
jgi:4-amino-4-deoxy-L-arabinose transferase-like glycosyltransferase